MGEYSNKIQDITGLEEKAFIKLFMDRNKDFVKAMQHNIDHGLRCIKMLNGQDQWDSSLYAQRKDEHRPCLTENLLPDFVNKPHGEFCMSTPQATVEPVDSFADGKTADVLKGLIYNTSYQSNGTAIHRDAFYNLLATGLAAWRLKTRYVDNKSFNVELYIAPIHNQWTIRWDLSAVAPDLSDKKWVIILYSFSKDDFEKKFGKEKWRPSEINKSSGMKDEGWWSSDEATVAEVFWIQEDSYVLYEHPDGSAKREKPEQTENKDGDELRKREEFDKKVWSCYISANEVLTEPEEWPDYTDEPIIPVIIVHGRKLVVEGKIIYKSLISDGLDIQQIHNYWITAITEALALQPDAPYLATEGQIAGYPEWTDLSKKVRAMRYRHDPKAGATMPQRQSPPQVSGSMINMPQYTRQALKDAIGLQHASLGIQSNEKSGVAIQKRKQEGDAGKFAFVENTTRGLCLEAKIQLNVLPTIMDTPRIERITGYEGRTDVAYINKKNPKTGEVIKLDSGKYDVQVVIGNTFATQRDEARELLGALIQYLGSTAPEMIIPLIPKFIKLANIPDAEDIYELAISMLPPDKQAYYKQKEEGDEPAIPPEVAKQIQALMLQMQQAEKIVQQQAQQIVQLQSDRDLKEKDLELKYQTEQERLQIERDRLMKDVSIKELDIQSKMQQLLIKIDADIELRVTELMERIKAEKELQAFRANLKGDIKEITSSLKEVQDGALEASNPEGTGGEAV